MVISPKLHPITKLNLDMKTFLAKSAVFLFATLIWDSSYSQDQCKSFGWVNYEGQNLAGAVAGGVFRSQSNLCDE
jgi:hypothetical protein